MDFHRLKGEFLTGIKANVLVLGLVSLFNDISSDMITPLLPMFVTVYLGAGAGVLGIIEGAAEAACNVSKLFSGWYSDRVHRRKPVIIAGYSISAFSKPLMAFATSWVAVFVIRVSDRIGKGTREAPRDALIAESTPKPFLGKAFGLHKALDNVGGLTGPLVAAGILSLIGTSDASIRAVFVLSFIPALVSLYLLSSKLREANWHARAGLQRQVKRSLWLPTFSRAYRRFILVAGLFAVANFGVVFFILRASSQSDGIAQAAVLFTLFNVVYTLSTMPFGMASDKWGRKIVLAVSYALFGVACMLLALEYSLWLGVAAFAVYAVSRAAYKTVEHTIAAELAPKCEKAEGLGAYNAIVGLLALPANIAAGFVWQYYGFQATFVAGAAVAFLAAAAAWVLVDE